MTNGMTNSTVIDEASEDRSPQELYLYSTAVGCCCRIRYTPGCSLPRLRKSPWAWVLYLLSLKTDIEDNDV